LVLGLLTAGLVEAQTLHREDAEVFPRDGGALLYRESHWVDESAAQPRRLVLYRCRDGRPFARKWVQTGERPQAPDFAYEDGRDGYREGVRGRGAQRVVYAGSREAQLQVPADGVIDAGFDAAVRANWEPLVAGQGVALHFLLPSRQQFVPVRVQGVGATSWHGVAAERFRMRLDRWFGFAVPAVDLVYARDDRRLLEFAGTGNVRAADGSNPQVRIVFAAHPQTSTVTEMNEAAGLTLAACGT
jgi:hypothetical protein